MAEKSLLKITPNTKSFMANGKKYLIEDSISEARWLAYQKLQLELAFNIQFSEMFQELKESYEALNRSKPADAAVRIYNLMHGIKQVGEAQVPTITAMCALFINREDEDRRIITDSMIEEKRNDWNEEGVDINSFFQLAVHSIPGFIEIYKEISQSTSNQ